MINSARREIFLFDQLVDICYYNIDIFLGEFSFVKLVNNSPEINNHIEYT